MEKVNEAALDWDAVDRGAAGWRRKKLAAATDASDIGCSLYELPPGKRSWPYHYHTANAEAMYVLAGEGSIRTSAGEDRLTAGDYVALPTGVAGAHRVINDGEEPLRYLMVSTMSEPEITVYPDSEKLGVYAGAPPGGDGERSVSGYYPADADVGYWEGEE